MMKSTKGETEAPMKDLKKLLKEESTTLGE